MFIQVRASNPGHPGRWRAGRHFANGATVRMEVVSDPAPPAAPLAPDEPKTPPYKNRDGETVAALPSMAQISRAGFAALKGDPLISVLADGETQGAASTAAYESVRAELADTQARLTAANARLAEAEAKHKELTAAYESVRAELTALKAAPPAAPPLAEAPADTATIDTKSKGKK